MAATPAPAPRRAKSEKRAKGAPVGARASPWKNVNSKQKSTPHFARACCAMLYDIMPYSTTLHYTRLYYATQYYTILYYTILYYTKLYSTLLYVYYTMLYYSMLYGAAAGWYVIQHGQDLSKIPNSLLQLGWQILAVRALVAVLQAWMGRGRRSHREQPWTRGS